MDGMTAGSTACIVPPAQVGYKQALRGRTALSVMLWRQGICLHAVRAHSITLHAAGVKRVQEQRELCDSKHAACTIAAQTVQFRGSGAVYHLHV